MQTANSVIYAYTRLRYQVSVYRTIGPLVFINYRGLNCLQCGSVAEWFVRWTTKLATRVQSRVAAGLPTGHSGLGGNLTGYCCQQYLPRLDDPGGNGTHRGLFWKQVVPSIPGGDLRRLPTLNKRPLPSHRPISRTIMAQGIKQ